jgi:hypothetical protein
MFLRDRSDHLDLGLTSGVSAIRGVSTTIVCLAGCGSSAVVASPVPLSLVMMRFGSSDAELSVHVSGKMPCTVDAKNHTSRPCRSV